MEENSNYKDFICGVNVKADSIHHAKDLFVYEKKKYYY
jgi:hypothetical protein